MARRTARDGDGGSALYLRAPTLSVSGTIGCAGGDGAAGLVYLDATSSSLPGGITPTEATP